MNRMQCKRKSVRGAVFAIAAFILYCLSTMFVTWDYIRPQEWTFLGRLYWLFFAWFFIVVGYLIGSGKIYEEKEVEGERKD